MQQSSGEPEGKHTGRWTKEQHQRFMYAIMQYGKDWKKVEQYVKTRSGSQVRSHAQKFFSKMQKGEGTERARKQTQEYSETEFDAERELNNELTPSTPVELVSLIRRQSKEEGGKIKLSEFRRSLEQQQPPSLEQEILSRANSFKSMSNILSAYEEINSKGDDPQDESFFISITKKYKRLFRQVEDFDRLIDIHGLPAEPLPPRNRKRSFTLPESEGLGEEEVEGKIEEIKKQINLEGERRERRESESSIVLLPGLNKLSTIQEHPLEEELLSFKGALPCEREEGQ